MYQNKNKIIFLFEQAEQYSHTYIQNGLGNLYNVFLENGYLSVTNEAVKFSYTGIAAHATNLFCILPKYLKGQLKTDKHYIDQAKQLIKVLKIYQTNVDLDIPDSEIVNYSSHSINSEISLADFILNDYLQNGLWSIFQKNVINNSENEILWDYTIEISYPVISNYPYYFDVYSNENLLVTNNIISKIHNWAIQYCTDKYSELLDIEIDANVKLISELTDIGDKYFLISAIEKELRITFNDRNIALLKALAELINGSGLYGENAYTLYGKNKFEHVWEAGVSFCFKNQYHGYKKYLSSPTWVSNSGTIISEKQTVRPDVIRWLNNENKSRVLIIDAKYYMFQFNEINQQSENNPGVGDIIKQYFYEFILSRSSSAADWLNFSTEYVNMLIFPGLFGTDKIMELIGSVFIENAVTNKPIINAYINPEILFNRYIRQESFSDIEIEELTSLNN